VNEAEVSPQDAMATGHRLSGQPVRAVHPAHPGGNNRVFQLEMAGGDRLALKYYRSPSIDGRDRLGQEYEALSFLAHHGIASTPRPIARDVHSNCALYQWLDGEAAALRPQADDVDQLAEFLVGLQRLRQAAGAMNLRNASASIFSANQAVAQCQERLTRLQGSAGEYPDLREFLDRDLVPGCATVVRRVEQRFADLGWDPAAVLSVAHRALSPSDFGLHNALRSPDGRLKFIDFEYFGWDDPVKLISDTAIHPGSNFSEASAIRLIEHLSTEFSLHDPSFAVRRDVLYPLFGMIWCLIILNDYLPESRSMRILSAQGGDLAARLAGQLDKARRLHQTICQRDSDLTSRGSRPHLQAG
jgi:hypothetical protein